MKKLFMSGEKWLFAAPLLFLAFFGVYRQWREATPVFIENPKYPNVSALEFSPDSQRLAVFSTDYYLSLQSRCVYDLASRSKICELALPSRLKKTGAAYGRENHYTKPFWSPDGRSIVGASSPSNLFPDKITTWDSTSGDVKLDRIYPKTTTEADDGNMRYSADGKTLIGEGVPPARFDAATGRRLSKPTLNLQGNRTSKSNAKLGIYASLSEEGDSLKVIDYKTNKLLWKPDHIREIYSYYWVEDVLYLSDDVARGGFSPQSPTAKMLVWDGKTRKPLMIPPVPSGSYIPLISFNRATNTLAYIVVKPSIFYQSTDEVVDSKTVLVVRDCRAQRELWRTEIPLQEEEELDVPAGGLGWSPNGKWLATAYKSGSVANQLVIFDRTGKRCFEYDADSIALFYWSPDSKRLAMTIGERSDNGQIVPKHIEIHRFED